MHECRRGTLEGTWQVSHSGSIDDDDEAVSWKAKKKYPSYLSVRRKRGGEKGGVRKDGWLKDACL